MHGQVCTVRRLGVIAEPDLSCAMEYNGVLNPGGIRAPDGSYLLFPRLVDSDNMSRVGVARVRYDGNIPVGIQHVGIALEPSVKEDSHGCEDPRVVYVNDWDMYVMTYVAFDGDTARIAFATSTDALSWTKRGCAVFMDDDNHVGTDSNKDGLLFPSLVKDPDGNDAWALIHRPTYSASAPLSMWMSYCSLSDLARQGDLVWSNHREFIAPVQRWESSRVGGGTPPILTEAGWLLFYHGMTYYDINGTPEPDDDRIYQAGMVVLDRDNPLDVLYRSAEPLWGPVTTAEKKGVVNDVVFPTAIDAHDGYFDVYYGMADRAIGCVRLEPVQ